jgi:hypothetical protein
MFSENCITNRKLKVFIVIVLSVTLAVSLCSCSENSNKDHGSDKESSIVIRYLDKDPKNDIYALNMEGVAHLAVTVIKVNKDDLPSDIERIYYASAN